MSTPLDNNKSGESGGPPKQPVQQETASTALPRKTDKPQVGRSLDSPTSTTSTSKTSTNSLVHEKQGLAQRLVADEAAMKQHAARRPGGLKVEAGGDKTALQEKQALAHRLQANNSVAPTLSSDAMSRKSSLAARPPTDVELKEPPQGKADVTTAKTDKEDEKLKVATRHSRHGIAVAGALAGVAGGTAAAADAVDPADKKVPEATILPPTLTRGISKSQIAYSGVTPGAYRVEGAGLLEVDESDSFDEETKQEETAPSSRETYCSTDEIDQSTSVATIPPLGMSVDPTTGQYIAEAQLVEDKEQVEVDYAVVQAEQVAPYHRQRRCQLLALVVLLMLGGAIGGGVYAATRNNEVIRVTYAPTITPSVAPTTSPSAAPSPGPCVGVDLVIFTDDYPDEFSLTVIGGETATSNVNETLGPFNKLDVTQEFRRSLCLSPGAYIFSADDSFEDGLFSPGYAQVIQENGCVIMENGGGLGYDDNLEGYGPGWLLAGTQFPVTNVSACRRIVDLSPTVAPEPSASPTDPGPCIEITMVIVTDDFPEEYSLNIRGGLDEVFDSFGPFKEGNKQREYRRTKCYTPAGLYTFEGVDSFGDGLVAPGFARVIQENGCVIMENGGGLGYNDTADGNENGWLLENVTLPVPAEDCKVFVSVPTPCTNVQLIIATDQYPEEYSMSLSDGTNDYSLGPFAPLLENQIAFRELTVCLPDGSYTVQAVDTLGDGLDSPGYAILLVEDEYGDGCAIMETGGGLGYDDQLDGYGSGWNQTFDLPLDFGSSCIFFYSFPQVESLSS